MSDRVENPKDSVSHDVAQIFFQLALKQSKMTGAFDRENVYYPGCYVLGPDAQFLKFPGTAQQIDMTMPVFTLDTISIQISFSLQYFLR